MTTAVSIQPTEHKSSTTPILKVALLDLYNGEKNLGISAIREIISNYNQAKHDVSLELSEFDIRQAGKTPSLDFDIYISSGGPGSPYDGVGTEWERDYFRWVDLIWQHNASDDVQLGLLPPKHVLFICHSFQMMCRHFNLGKVTERKSQSFGVFATHPTPAGLDEPLFEGLQDPFYVADFRDWQVIQPDHSKIEELGASILAYEKERPHVPLERAVMAIRISDEMVGVQFHPEADPEGMLIHFQKDNRRQSIISTHGEEKFNQIMDRLRDPDFLHLTYQTVIPNFLHRAVAANNSWNN